MQSVDIYLYILGLTNCKIIENIKIKHLNIFKLIFNNHKS